MWCCYIHCRVWGWCSLDMKKYMTFKASWEKYAGMDENTHMGYYDDPVTIDCFIYGKDIFIRENSGASVVNARVYLTLADVSPKDKIDGQVVKSVNSYPENWDANGQLYEVLTWNS